MLKISFHGAAREVTGSAIIVEKDGFRVLIDCGMVQGKRKESFERNRNFSFDPSTINAMVLTHAHIDHSGNIPTAAVQGFRGPVFSTYATRDLCSIMLPDSAYVQMKDLEYVNKKRAKQGLTLFDPLYTIEQAEKSMKLFVPKNLGEHFKLCDGLEAYFLNSGHILGSSMAVLKYKEAGIKLKIGFTGDLGRKKLPILRPPDELYEVDYLICESTYGGRDHNPVETALDKLAEIITATHRRGGKVIVPVFAVERAQEMLYVLNELALKEMIPAMPIFVDSPLTIEATEIFKKHSECFNEEMMEFIADNNNPFYLELVKYIRDVEESKVINEYPKPCIILSATGMCEAGRILHHLKNNISNPNNTILIVGYQAVNTLGRQLVDGNKDVKIFGEPYRVNADVKVINEFSGHAGHEELVAFVKRASSPRLKRVFLVHGEPESQETLKQALAKEGVSQVINPEHGYEEVLVP